ncbi:MULTISPECIES: hypothetical protein [Klebsiella]|uniref:hypothetical protein n=1 Tax=Klebsiella TaxID=570 RepID=UPI000B40C97D|nr:hypothetical protein [Klebsiella quasipneumoniae]AVO79984.1 hypothetical protein AM459_23890 [Klebsiella pneumoniae]MDS1017387.1 hypothetical protein [Klebsiella quasipneumoniae]NBZ45904.1 hypothetical protein [Klebsiella quasipneumoniae]
MPLPSPFSGRLFPRSCVKISEKFFPPTVPAAMTRGLKQVKKSAPARIFTVFSAKTFHKETK